MFYEEGTVISIINAGEGAYGANGKVGTVTKEKSNHGLREEYNGFNVKLSDNNIWRVGFGGEYTILDRPNYKIDIPDIKKVISHPPATIIYWCDDTKTVVKCKETDEYDIEKGIALCFMKRVLGNKGNYNNILKEIIKNSQKY